MNIFKIVIKILLGLSSGPLYFILVLFQLTILAPFLIKKIQSNSKSLFMITPIYLLMMYFYSIIYGRQMPFYQTFFPAWFIFYYLGLWIKINGYKPVMKTNKVVNSVLICFIGLIFSIIEGYLLLSFGFSAGFASSQIKVSSFFYVLTLINLLMTIKPYFKNKEMMLLNYVGDNSYGIYYVHVIWIIISNKFLSSILIIKGILPIYQLAQVVIVLIFSISSIFVTKQILGKKISGKLLGF